MRREPGFANAAASAGLDRPEIRVVPGWTKPPATASPETISETVRVATIGDADANLAKFNAETARSRSASSSRNPPATTCA